MTNITMGAGGARSARAPGALQGWILVSTAWLAVAATSLIAPVLPRMEEHFASTPNAELLVQVSIALPALFVALLAAPFGWLADRIGRRVILLSAMLFYCASGMAPIFLDRLDAILVSRAGVGIAEAAIVTAGTALLSDYFFGAQRDRWFAIQTGSVTLMAVVFLALGGALGEVGWRAPYAVYALPLLLAVLVYGAIWEPVRHREIRAGERPGRSRMPWGHMSRAILVTFFTSIAFYVVIIQLPFLLTERGYSSPFLIGMAAAAGSVAAPLGAMLFGAMGRRSASFKLALSFAVSGAGLAIIGLTADYTLTLVGAGINGFGSGIALPTIMTLTMAGLSQDQRGRGSGLWTTAFFLGQFLSPMSFFALSAILGGTAEGFVFWACVVGIAAVAAAVLSMAGVRRPARQTSDLGVRS